MGLIEGDRAPAFKLPDQNGNLIGLAEYEGWRLVWWLPSTLVEHAAHCGDRIAAEFAKQAASTDLVILGLSFDSAEQSREFVRRASITFPMLTADIETGQAYGVYRDGEEWACFPRKRAFLVDPDGLVAKVYLNIDPDYFVPEVLADLDDLTHWRVGVWKRMLLSLKG